MSAKPSFRVAVLGATGMVGQWLVHLLDRHPWFRVVALTGSDRSVGRPYGQACRWLLSAPMPDWAAGMVVQPTEPGFDAEIVISALPSDIAREVEPRFAAAGYLVASNASAYRMAPDVPLVMPDVNFNHMGLLPHQQKTRGWSGALITNPNCTTTAAVLPLKALMPYGVRRVHLVSLQALSGAGYPGVSAVEIADNVLPYIPGEEEKLETEPRKLLGELQDGRVEAAPVRLSAQTNRVPTLDGHLICLSVELEESIRPEEAVKAMNGYRPPEEVADLPSAVAQPIVVRTEPDRPQPRLDRMTGGGMSVVVGRVQPCPVFTLKFVALTHNTIRGAAGAALFNAEAALRWMGRV
ncbi:aspartate-semialdehyde dehydrogenase [Thermoflexus sp.]|uniref:aspartate-semialdehyde dehydrogenase n=1 Tax=Thermoflexus sp. TaxID=1969742 RepID=UPI0035E422EE